MHADLPVLLIIVLFAAATMLFILWRAKKEYKEEDKEQHG